MSEDLRRRIGRLVVGPSYDPARTIREQAIEIWQQAPKTAEDFEKAKENLARSNITLTEEQWKKLRPDMQADLVEGAGPGFIAAREYLKYM